MICFLSVLDFSMVTSDHAGYPTVRVFCAVPRPQDRHAPVQTVRDSVFEGEFSAVSSRLFRTWLSPFSLSCCRHGGWVARFISSIFFLFRLVWLGLWHPAAEHLLRLFFFLLHGSVCYEASEPAQSEHHPLLEWLSLPDLVDFLFVVWFSFAFVWLFSCFSSEPVPASHSSPCPGICF
jgi:hypothetical protein